MVVSREKSRGLTKLRIRKQSDSRYDKLAVQQTTLGTGNTKMKRPSSLLRRASLDLDTNISQLENHMTRVTVEAFTGC